MASPHFHLEAFEGELSECETYLNQRYQGIKAMGGTLLPSSVSFHPHKNVSSALTMRFVYTLDPLPDNSIFIDSTSDATTPTPIPIQ